MSDIVHSGVLVAWWFPLHASEPLVMATGVVTADADYERAVLQAEPVRTVPERSKQSGVDATSDDLVRIADGYRPVSRRSVRLRDVSARHSIRCLYPPRWPSLPCRICGAVRPGGRAGFADGVQGARKYGGSSPHIGAGPGGIAVVVKTARLWVSNRLPQVRENWLSFLPAGAWIEGEVLVNGDLGVALIRRLVEEFYWPTHRAMASLLALLPSV